MNCKEHTMTQTDKDKNPSNFDPARQQGQGQKNALRPDDQKLKDEAEGRKATQFDGNPNVEKASDGPFGPQDDTPWRLKKKD